MKTPLDHDTAALVHQRSKFIENVCLLGVCFHLLTHEPGSMTVPAYLRGRRG